MYNYNYLDVSHLAKPVEAFSVSENNGESCSLHWSCRLNDVAPRTAIGCEITLFSLENDTVSDEVPYPSPGTIATVPLKAYVPCNTEILYEVTPYYVGAREMINYYPDTYTGVKITASRRSRFIYWQLYYVSSFEYEYSFFITLFIQ